MSESLRYKGKFIKRKILEEKEKFRVRITAQRMQQRKCVEVNAEICSGNRIVDLKYLGEQLWCTNCRNILSLNNIEGEKRNGMHSKLFVKCQQCLKNKHIYTGKYCEVSATAGKIEDQKHSDLTTKAVLGTIHAGIGCTQLNKILACLDIPTVSSYIYRKYEQEVGRMIEKAAEQSCKKAAAEERELVIQKVEEMSEVLPQEIRTEFSQEQQDLSTNSQKFDLTLGRIVNIIVSYDMGWSKRGNGKSYDSLNGYGTIIGFLTGKILDYRTRNRKCRLCDVGKPKESHDCRQNFRGSAKAMEADVGAELINRSNILKGANLNVKVLIGDEDSSVMAAVNKENSRLKTQNKIYKLADRNHVKKNLSKKLYKIKSNYKEMNKKGLISHIKKCFSYAVAQNAGQSGKLAKAVKCIPDHLYNNHENCGSWCKRNANNSGTIKQKFILKDEKLYAELLQIFSVYSENAFKYCVNASSQVNEAVNNIISHQLPKNKCYSTSSSADFRVATGVLIKNEGHSYIKTVKKLLGLSNYKESQTYCDKSDTKRLRASLKSKTIEKKRRRIQLTENRENMRKKLESKEGVTYEGNIAFELDLLNTSCNDSNVSEVAVQSTTTVYFDLETSGFNRQKSDILQIAAKAGEQIFSLYIEPTQSIAEEVTKINSLQNISGELYYKSKRVQTVSIFDALLAFHEFLSKISTSCILVAHNAPFDTALLIREIRKNGLINEFKTVLYGFCDSLQLFKTIFKNRKGPNMFKLSKLAEDFLPKNNDEEHHEALFDCTILEKLVIAYIPMSTLFKETKLYTYSVNNVIQRSITFRHAASFKDMKSVLSNYMINKIANSGITYYQLRDVYVTKGKDGIIEILSKKNGGKPIITKCAKVLNSIIEFFKQASND